MIPEITEQVGWQILDAGYAACILPTLMASILLVIVCICIGLLAQRSRRFPHATGQALNAFVVVVSLPALVFTKVHALGSQGFAGSVAIPISMAWIQFALAAALAWFGNRVLRFSRPTTGALLLTVGLGNTSFVGFPLLEAIFGPDAIQTGVLVDQPGSFLALSTVGVLSAAILSKGSHSARGIVIRVVTFPPFLAMALSAALWRFSLPAIVESALERLGGTLVPVALVSVGYQLKPDPRMIRARVKPLAFGLLSKLVLVPAFMSVLYLVLLPHQGRVTEVTVVESAMAPMITAGILASDSKLDPELSSLMVGVGILLSLVTVPLWAHLLGFF